MFMPWLALSCQEYVSFLCLRQNQITQTNALAYLTIELVALIKCWLFEGALLLFGLDQPFLIGKTELLAMTTTPAYSTLELVTAIKCPCLEGTSLLLVVCQTLRCKAEAAYTNEHTSLLYFGFSFCHNMLAHEKSLFCYLEYISLL
jgi:hypothetical protein